MRLSQRIHVDRAPEVVFRLWGALERSGEYLDGPQRIRQTDGPTGVGTRWKAIERWPGRTVEFTVELVQWRPNTFMQARFSEPLAGGWRASFQPAGDAATDINFVMELRPAGLLGLLTTLARPWASRQTRRGLTSFRAWAEAQPSPKDG